MAGLNGKVQIKEVTSEYFKKEYFADRPYSERLINKRLNDLDLNVMRDWNVALKEYLEEYYVGYLD